MKTILKTTILATSLIIALTACSEKDKDNTTNVHADASMKADELADAGEQLVSPYTFMLSDKVFDMALEKDPSNKKAQFYKAFVKRMMVLKGIGKRIAPLMKKGTAKQQADYEKAKTDLPDSPLKSFLLDGPEDIKSYSQLVSVIADYNSALNDFRKFLKLNAGTLDLTLNLNPHIFEKEINDQAAHSCSWTQSPEGAIDVQCETAGIAQKKVNTADLIALQQMTGGEMLYWSLYTAYDLSTVEEIAKNERLKTMPPQEVLAYYKSLPSLGKLNKNQTLSLIPELGSDFSASVKWAQQYQGRLCPKGVKVPNQRRGFLFKDGVCVETTNEVNKALAMLDQMVSGIYTQPILDEQGQQVDQIRVNLVGFLKNPPQDLKAFLPESIDQNGKTPQWSDNTLGGLFPDGDIQKLRKEK
ncbi:MAG TPA: hypothetical protein VIG33_05855 [Pseudobdellovibrionaceae bacterium]